MLGKTAHRKEMCSVAVILVCRRGWCGLVSLLRSLHNNILTTLSPLWRISNIIVSRQAGDFVSTQIGVRTRRSAVLDQGDLTESVWYQSGSPGMRRSYRMYLVKEDMGYTIPRIDCDHTVEVGLGFFKEALGRFVIFPTVGILRHVKADRSSVSVKDGIVLVWKRRKIPGNGTRESGRA